MFRDLGAILGSRFGVLGGLAGYGFGWYIENSINTDINALANDIQTRLDNGEYVPD
ncbi:hypothetical protein HMPREF9370_2347 [Neisseria wadsworthii 9715]|uniref:Uncharacterized protein n=2 Tax=Neisseria TaxID=482 RepID=G4CTD7_9NEIS|nr:hypothetical protein HMPREF9370_2347 [Neisseria wadsworthii 9715]